MRDSNPDPFATEERLTTLIGQDEIARRVKEMGAEISRDYPDGDLVLVGILKGSFLFLADLVRAIDVPVAIDFMRVRSYGSRTESSGVVEISADLTSPVQGKHVLFVEDIVDTGLTMAYLQEFLKTRHPRSVKLCALLHKPERILKPVHIDYLGFTIPNKFVVGFGLDYEQRCRNLPYIGEVEGVAGE